MMTKKPKTMLLEDEYYTLIDSQTDSVTGCLTIRVNPASRIFEGHFPGNPICPGVCGVELIRECASIVLAQEVRISKINKCRFLSVARPQEDCRFCISIATTPMGDGSCLIKAKMSDGKADYISFSGVVV